MTWALAGKITVAAICYIAVIVPLLAWVVRSAERWKTDYPAPDPLPEPLADTWDD